MFLARLAIAMMLVVSAVWAQSVTPPVLVNGKIKLAEVGEKGRIHVEYDVRSLGAAGLKVYLFRHDEDPAGPARKQWHFGTPAGRERISLNDEEIAVYKMWAVAVDAAGAPVAAPTINPTWICYGGWRAWEAYENPDPDLSVAPPVFSDVPTQADLRGREVSVQIVPAAVVMKPNEAVELQVVLSGLPEDDSVSWAVDGDGYIQPNPEAKNSVYYVSPSLQGTRMFRVTATSDRDPSIFGTASILVSSMRQDTGEQP